MSRRIMRPLPVFILETINQTNNKCLPKFVQTGNASSSILRKTAIEELFFASRLNQNRLQPEDNDMHLQQSKKRNLFSEDKTSACMFTSG